ncbi:MAG: preprotein translocase subunit SecG [Bacteroidales bacterium]|nr:preprotein translocase subunit SecG [Bacteroidales bacterium]
MYTLFSILILIVCVLLAFVVLVQNSKGGGLASSFSSSNQYMGVRKTADFLEKATWTLSILLLVFSLATVFSIPRHQGEDNTTTNQKVEMIQSGAQEKAAQPMDSYTPPPAAEKE